MHLAPPRSPSFPSELIGRFTETATAFQPIVDVPRRAVYAHEALARGIAGEPAAEVFQKIPADDLDRFDQSLRIVAIYEAARLRLDTRLHLNFLPNALRCPERTAEDLKKAASDAGLACAAITFEIVGSEKHTDLAGAATAFEYFRSFGFLVALDDCTGVQAGQDLVSAIRPDVVKLDLRAIPDDPARAALVEKTAATCRELGVTLIAKGVETAAESSLLLAHGISLQQGYLFARPAFRSLAKPWS